MSDLQIVTIVILILTIIETIFIIKSRQCKHNWKTIKQGEILSRTGPEFGAVIGYYYILQCEKCGKIKKENF